MTPAELRTEIESGPLAAELAPLWEAGDDAGCARRLRERAVTRLAPPPLDTLAQLMPLLGASFPAVFGHPRFSDLRDTFNRGNRAGVVEFAVAFHAARVITAAERDAVVGYLTTAMEQPLPLVPGCTHEMVSAAREAA